MSSPILLTGTGAVMMGTERSGVMQDHAQVKLEPGDIFFTRGEALVSRAIRRVTQQVGEKRTEVNHVGLVVEPGAEPNAVVVEALSRVQRHQLGRYDRIPKTKVAVFRPISLDDAELAAILANAERYVGMRYGYGKLLAHLADWALQGAYVFRRFTADDDYPICSWLVAQSFSKAGKHFGVEPGAADPDDIWDFVTTRVEHYAPVRPLSPYLR